MEELWSMIVNHVRVTWRFRWVALGVAAIACIVGWIGVIALPDQYQVSTKVFLDTRSMLGPALRGLAITSRAQQDASFMIQRTLLIRPNLEAVARKTDMDLKAKTPEEFEEVLQDLIKNIGLSGTSRDNIFVLSYSNPDPQLATRVVEAILNLFVEKSLGESRKDTSKTKKFLDSQIAEHEARLIAAENRLKEFKRKNVGMMPKEGRNYFVRLESVNARLAEATLALEEASRRRDEYRRQIDGVDPLFETEIQTPVRVKVTHPLDSRIAALEEQLDRLLLQYTERHPDVVAARDMLGSLKAEREQDLKDNPPPTVARPRRVGTENSVYQEMSVALGAAEAEVAALQARVESYQEKVGELAKLVDTIPRIEAEYARLNRDYEVYKDNYEALVKRRESLKLGEEAAQSVDGVQFNILEPPRVPLTPTGPNRPLMSAGVLFAGLGIGVGFAWLLGMLRPSLFTTEDVEQVFDLPVLGSVSRVWTRGEMLRRRAAVASFVLGVVVLFGMFSGLVALESTHAEVLAKFRKLDVADRISQVVKRAI